MSDQGTVYAGFIATEAIAELERRKTIDARGLAVITSAGTFVTLALALVTVVAGRDFDPEPNLRLLFGASATLFAGAAILGVLSAVNLGYEVGSVDTLEQMLGPHWSDDEVDARNAVASLRLRTMRRLRAGNNLKAQLLFVALCVEVIAFIVLGLAVFVQSF